MIFNLVCTTVVNETPPSVSSSITVESEMGTCVSEEKNDICPANESKDAILIKENSDETLFRKESLPIEEQDDSDDVPGIVHKNYLHNHFVIQSWYVFFRSFDGVDGIENI